MIQPNQFDLCPKMVGDLDLDYCYLFDGVGDNILSGFYGYSCSIDVNSKGEPAISFYNSSFGDLMFAYDAGFFDPLPGLAIYYIGCPWPTNKPENGSQEMNETGGSYILVAAPGLFISKPVPSAHRSGSLRSGWKPPVL